MDELLQIMRQFDLHEPITKAEHEAVEALAVKTALSHLKKNPGDSLTADEKRTFSLIVGSILSDYPFNRKAVAMGQIPIP